MWVHTKYLYHRYTREESRLASDGTTSDVHPKSYYGLRQSIVDDALSHSRRRAGVTHRARTREERVAQLKSLFFSQPLLTFFQPPLPVGREYDPFPTCAYGRPFTASHSTADTKSLYTNHLYFFPFFFPFPFPAPPPPPPPPPAAPGAAPTTPLPPRIPPLAPPPSPLFAPSAATIPP